MLPRLARHSFSGSFEVQKTVWKEATGREDRAVRWRQEVKKTKQRKKVKLQKTPRRWSPGCRRPAPWPPDLRSADKPRCGWRGSERCPGRSGTEAGEAGRYFLPGNPPVTKTGVRQRAGKVDTEWSVTSEPTWSESSVTLSPSLAMPSSFSSFRCGQSAMQKALATFSVRRLWSAGSLRPLGWSSLWRKNTCRKHEDGFVFRTWA